jgi:DNA invertase Pin-like site-specific DNA recombinase
MKEFRPKYVSYIRVSTAKQGRSGLGLEAQRESVGRFVGSRGGEIVAPEYVEIESGRWNERPELERALKRCRQTRATLVVAKLDRLSRDAEFLLRLQKSSVNFVAADLPDANELTVGFMAIIAQHERKAISDRTKAALAAAKARGTVLGGVREGAANIAEYQGQGVQAARKKAKDFAEENRDDVEPLVREGLSLRAIAGVFNEGGILAPRGGSWSAQTIKNLIGRLKIDRQVTTQL